jgi:hypothetical protein
MLTEIAWFSAISENRPFRAESVALVFGEAINEGFTEKTISDYQFVHDLIDETEEGRLHLLIGEAFLFSSDGELRL